MAEPQTLSFAIDEAGAELRLPPAGVPLRLAHRTNVPAPTLLDARELFNRRLALHGIIADGLEAIRGGRSADDAARRAEEYLRQAAVTERAIWEACQLSIALLLIVPEGLDLMRVIPKPSDALHQFAAALYARSGLSLAERDNLIRGALEDNGILLPEPGGQIRRCECADLHRRGRCPNWPPFAWHPRARKVWDDWRSAKVGGALALTLAYLDGAAILNDIHAGLEAEALQAAIRSAAEKEPCLAKQ